MGTAGRLTPETGAPAAEAPGFLPALEAGRSLTFRATWGYRAALWISGVLLSASGVYLLVFNDHGLSPLSRDAGVHLILTLAVSGLGVFALYLAAHRGVVSLRLDEQGIQVLYAGSRSHRLRWDEIAGVQRYWPSGVHVVTKDGRRILVMNRDMDHGTELLSHLKGVAWLNQARPLFGRGLTEAVREAVKSGALRFRPAKQVPALRRWRWLRLAGAPILSAIASLVLIESGDEALWLDVLLIAFFWLWPILEIQGLWKLMTGYDATIELTRRGLVARQPNAAESHLSWNQLDGAELDESRRGIEILAEAGRIGVGELEHEFFFWDILGLLREDLRDEIYGFAIAD